VISTAVTTFGFDAAAQVNLNPLFLFNQVRVAVLRVHPLNEAGSGKARRVNGEVSFDGLQRQATNLDQFFEKRSKSRILKITRDRIVMRRSRQIALSVRVFQIGSEAATGQRRVDLEGRRENHIAKRQARTPVWLNWFFNAAAQFSQQGKKPRFLMRLSFVVSRPFLLIGLLDADSLGVGLCFAIIAEFALDDDLNRVKVFASPLSGGEVRAGAMRFKGVRFDGIKTVIAAVLTLRRNKPSVTVLLQLSGRCYYKSSLFSFLLFVHCVLAFR